MPLFPAAFKCLIMMPPLLLQSLDSEQEFELIDDVVPVANVEGHVEVLQAMNDGTEFHTRVEEGTTCWCRFADLYCFYLWKFFYRDEFVTVDAQRTKPRFTVPERRVLSTQMVAKAWNSCKQKKMEPYAARAFKEWGLLPNTPSAEILPFRLRGKGFKYVPNPPQVAKFELELAARAAAAEAPAPAKPKPKQLPKLSMSAFLKNTVDIVILRMLHYAAQFLVPWSNCPATI